MTSLLRMTVVLILFLACTQAGSQDADAPTKWEEKRFFARRPGRPVPPPQYFATANEQPADAEVRIKVVRVPKMASVSLVHFLGGPVFTKGVVKDFTDPEINQVLTYKLSEKMKVGICAKLSGADGVCRGVEQKDGKTLLKYGAGEEELVLEVEIVSK